MLKVLKALGTLALMVVCGFGAYVTTALALMNLGLALHNQYDYYVFSTHSPGAVLAYVAAAIGFLTPGCIVWNRHNFADYKLSSKIQSSQLVNCHDAHCGRAGDTHLDMVLDQEVT